MKGWATWMVASLLLLCLVMAGLLYGFYLYGAWGISAVPEPSTYRAPIEIRRQFIALEATGVDSLPGLNPLTYWVTFCCASNQVTAQHELRLLGMAAGSGPPHLLHGSFQRHAARIAGSVMVSRSWSLQQVIDTVLANAYFGRGTHGIEAAARTYYGLPANRLDAEQSLALVAIIKGPEFYHPDCHRERFDQRYLQAAALAGMSNDLAAPSRALTGWISAKCMPTSTAQDPT
ncbi:MAG: hypothetical protein EOP02_10070 [Proteobacteria bacterium]|nr:MAG: hypothetical protein EOP02_10070 [Pseudomonadota bacterium]